MSDAQPTLTSLPQILSARQSVSAHEVRFSVPPDWLQGRTTFGGLLSALAVQAMRDVCGSNWPLRALQTNFVGPVLAGHFDVEVTLLRQGKNIRQVQARALQHQEGASSAVVCGVLLGVFGTGRESALPVIRPAQAHVQRTAEQAAVWPYIPDMMPAFTQHLEFRHAEGGVPFSNSRDAYSRTYTRLKMADGVDTELLSVLLADAGPTPALAMLPGFAPASSVSWALELRPVGEADVQGLWRMDKDAVATGEGYVNETTTLWTPCGQLAALGYQVVAVYG